MQTTEKIRRLNLDLPPTAMKQLEGIRDRIEAPSFTEVIRRALAVYDALTSYVKRGAKLQVVNSDGSVETILNLF